MLRGTTLFRCPNCGHVFKAFDIEDSATARSTPRPCPRCGAKGYPQGLFGTSMDTASDIIGRIRSIMGGKNKLFY